MTFWIELISPLFLQEVKSYWGAEEDSWFFQALAILLIRLYSTMKTWQLLRHYLKSKKRWVSNFNWQTMDKQVKTSNTAMEAEHQGRKASWSKFQTEKGMRYWISKTNHTIPIFRKQSVNFQSTLRWSCYNFHITTNSSCFLTAWQSNSWSMSLARLASKLKAYLKV